MADDSRTKRVDEVCSMRIGILDHDVTLSL